MRTLILGAAGMLGHKVFQHLCGVEGQEVFGLVRRAASDYDRYAAIFEKGQLVDGIDVLEGGALEDTLADIAPDAIVNCVGIVKQLREADDRLLSITINSLLPHRLARWCERADCRLIHLSTDCVFEGSRGSYLEDDDADARDLYGRTKFLGETDSSESQAITLRTSIVGRELGRPTHGLLEWFLAQESSVKGFARAMYTGFTTLEMARIIERILTHGRGLSGLYHVASGVISKYDLLLLVRRHFGSKIEVERDESFVCDRSLIMKRFSKATGYQAPSWDEMIRELAQDSTPYAAWQRRNGA